MHSAITKTNQRKSMSSVCSLLFMMNFGWCTYDARRTYGHQHFELECHRQCWHCFFFFSSHYAVEWMFVKHITIKFGWWWSIDEKKNSATKATILTNHYIRSFYSILRLIVLLCSNWVCRSSLCLPTDLFIQKFLAHYVYAHYTIFYLCVWYQIIISMTQVSMNHRQIVCYCSI